MTRDEVIETIRAHLPELRRLGVAHLSLFGSLARGEDTPKSDVDILVEFEQPPVGLFAFARVQAYLEEVLGRPVDLVSPGALRPEIRKAILSEAVRAA